MAKFPKERYIIDHNKVFRDISDALITITNPDYYHSYYFY